MAPIGHIAEIWRYPVSSVGGELVVSARVSATGLTGDRQFALIDVETGRPAAPEKEARWRKTLALQANSRARSLPELTFPDQRCFALDDPSLERRFVSILQLCCGYCLLTMPLSAHFLGQKIAIPSLRCIC